jgi:gamma-glutamyltranspeptidase/glutathione hydrolase
LTASLDAASVTAHATRPTDEQNLIPAMLQHPFALVRCVLAAVLTISIAVLPTHRAAAQRAPVSGPTRSAPEAATGRHDQALAISRRHMVSTANFTASEAGRQILRDGGNAVDAAIAIQLVLNLVEPQSSGIGGGAFLLHFDAATRTLKSYDGRETAPATARPDRFLGADGKPIPFTAAVASGAAVGVPGVLAMLELAHRRHGRLPWARLFVPAITLAREGFLVSPRLALLLDWMGPDAFSAPARHYFFDAAGKAWSAGHRLRNPDFVATLERLAAEGARALHEGPIAESIIQAVAAGPAPVGGLTLADLAAYRPREREPVCVPYRGLNVCGMGPPSSGAHTVGQTLRLIERFDLGTGPSAALNARAMHIIAEAEKLAYADRNRYLADPDFARIPAGLLDETYLARRRALIAPLGAAGRVRAGNPDGKSSALPGEDGTVEASGTSHTSIIDGDGSAVSMTTTIEAAFGSRIWAAGFLLNNELTDFSFRSTDAQGRPIANRIEGGKRPRSSMAPTIVFDRNGDVKAVLGSPGGSRIILYVVKSIVALVDWNMDAQAAAALANFGSRGQGFELEATTSATDPATWRPWTWGTTIWQALRLKPFGHRIDFDQMTSGTHIVVRRGPDHLEGGADPRREGAALGD